MINTCQEWLIKTNVSLFSLIFFIPIGSLRGIFGLPILYLLEQSCYVFIIQFRYPIASQIKSENVTNWIWINNFNVTI